MEVSRLRAHFDSVVTEMSSARTDRLDATQRARRALLVTELQRYRNAGSFPENRDFAGRAVPYFVDKKTGAICAVGHLLVTSGRGDIVAAVSSADNNVLVSQLAGNLKFRAWLDSVGISLAEAGRIQVPYMDGEEPGRIQIERTPNMGYVAGSAAATGTSLAAAMWNATVNKSGRGEMASFLGIGAGAISIAWGAAGPQSGYAPGYVRAGSIVSGTLSMMIGARGLHRRNVLAQRETTAKATARAAARTSVTPLLVTDQASGAGISVSIRF